MDLARAARNRLETRARPIRATGADFDILGRDVTLTGNAQPGVTFCTNIRGDWLQQDQLIRAEVRVYWPRQLFAAPSATFCSGSETPDTTGTGGGTQVPITSF